MKLFKVILMLAMLGVFPAYGMGCNKALDGAKLSFFDALVETIPSGKGQFLRRLAKRAEKDEEVQKISQWLIENLPKADSHYMDVGFEWKGKGGIIMKGEVAIERSGDRYTVEIIYVGESKSEVGDAVVKKHKQVAFELANFLGSILSGINSFVTNAKQISEVEIVADTVQNQNLMNQLIEFGFTTSSGKQTLGKTYYLSIPL